MSVPEEIRVRLSHWCTAHVPDDERALRQIAYTTSGDEVTILDRRPPTFPELGAAWTATPVARLRRDDPEPGLWTLHRPVAENSPDAWERDVAGPADDPLVLLARVEDAVRAAAPPRNTGPASG
ncbi:DUF3024 domain-containing protein [Pseudonocardia bannensis]|uniref:Uncharacterized protein n=1 Tax=Pseudonocardia bannensis TaxID=630973 RepID=A0A848DFN6_9PSEU|nr:hypothetical protein [Pseudonocardia bannensis]NMH91353.1 hypothetical protein [Pseudonocardia bannensis]